MNSHLVKYKFWFPFLWRDGTKEGLKAKQHKITGQVYVFVDQPDRWIWQHKSHNYKFKPLKE